MFSEALIIWQIFISMKCYDFITFLVTKSSINFIKKENYLLKESFSVSHDYENAWIRINQNVRFQTFFHILTLLKIFILTVNKVKCKQNQSYKDADGLHVPGNTCYCVHNNQVARDVNEWMNLHLYRLSSVDDLYGQPPINRV